jgi:hypothetical protein
MDAPVCRVCGVKHWVREPHVWAGEPRTRAKPVLPASAPGHTDLMVSPEAIDEALAAAPPPPAAKPSRREYQRAYQATRRAADRAAVGGVKVGFLKMEKREDVLRRLREATEGAPC